MDNKDILSVKHDIELKLLIQEYQFLGEKGQLPPNSEFRKLGEQLARIYGNDFSIEFTAAILRDEVFKRFLWK